MPRLIINPRLPNTWEVQLKEGINHIGRGFSNDFRIEDPSVSGSHCQITLEGDTAVLRDLGSTNGTTVERVPITEAVLRPGQTFHLGNVEVAYQADATSAKITDTIQLPRPAPAVPAASVAAPGAPVVRINRPAVAATAAPIAPPVAFPAPVAYRTAPGPAPTLAPVPPAPFGSATPATQAPVHAPAGAEHHCKFHPRTLGRFFCGKCQHFFCELCVATRAVGGVQKKFCRHCGTECSAVQIEAHAAARRAAGPSFYARIPSAFAYPFKGAGVLVLAVGTILFGCLNMMNVKMRFVTGGIGAMSQAPTWSLIFRVFAIGYLFAFIQSILQATAVGDEEMPELPSMANFWEDILLPCLQMLGLTLFCFGPAILLQSYAISQRESSLGPAMIAALAFGCLYFPMALLAVAILDSVMAANPVQVVPSILKVPVQYLVAVALLAFVLALRPVGDLVIPMVFPRGLTTHNMAKLFGYLGANLFWSFFSLYLLVVGMRILGLLYLTNKEKLGWLDR